MSPHTDLVAHARWRRPLRRLLRGRALALAAMTALAVSPALAVAGTGGSSPSSGSSGSSSSTATHKAGARTLHPGSTGPAVKRLQRRLHVHATGYYGKLTKRAVKRFQRRHGLKADGIAGPRTLRKLGLTTRAASSSPRLPAVLKRIAECESGGNPRAVSPDGRYRGKYQFDQSTWEAWGGNGDPAKTRERVQDRVALRLYRARGTAPWPNCG